MFDEVGQKIAWFECSSSKPSEEGIPSMGSFLPIVNPCEVEESMDGQVRSLKTEYR